MRAFDAKDSRLLENNEVNWWGTNVCKALIFKIFRFTFERTFIWCFQNFSDFYETPVTQGFYEKTSRFYCYSSVLPWKETSDAWA